MARVAWLSAFWILYIGIPAYFGMFFIDHIPFPYYWDDVLRHALSSLGYGLAGCLFYAWTGPIRTANMILRRLYVAMGFNFLVLLWLFVTGMSEPI